MKKNIVFGFTVILLTFVVIAIKFTHIQIFQAEELQRDVVEQRVRKVKETPERGTIKDTNGKVLAMSLNVKDIAVYPNLITSDKSRKEIASLLSETLDLDEKEIFENLSKKDENGKYSAWLRIARRVDPESANQLKESKFSRLIEITGSPKRYYPNNKLASNILGFVNEEGLPGGGLEISLNHYLSGISGYKVAEFDNMNNEIPIGLQTISKPVPGQSVNLTIDSYIQYTLEKTIEKYVEEMKPKEMHTIVMEPSTGKILGMASYPNFDPNEYGEYDPLYINRNAASYVFEPGSTFKPLYMALALEQGTINKDTVLYDGAGVIAVNGQYLKNWNRVGLGSATLQDIIINSSNVGMVQISQTLTSEQIVEGLSKARIGQKLGVELPNEESGLFPGVEAIKSDPLMKATQAFGQGISVTPLQMITSFSEIINGGFRIQPTLIEKVTDEMNQTKYEWNQKEQERVYSKETSELIKTYLKANKEFGSGKAMQIEGYDAGGKTGSAWKVENNVYKSGAIIGSYIGFIPYENPKYVMLSVVDEPTGLEFGGQSAGPLFKDAMEEIMRYKNEPKTVEVEATEQTEEVVYDGPDEYLIKNYKLKLVEEVEKDLKKQFGKKVVIHKEGDGNIVIDQRYRIKDGKLNIYLETTGIVGEGFYAIPNFKDMTIEEVEGYTEEESVKIEVIGKGTVQYQSIEPGVYQQKISKIRLWMK